MIENTKLKYYNINFAQNKNIGNYESVKFAVIKDIDLINPNDVKLQIELGELK